MMITYKNAGVDIEAGEKLVNRIKPLVRTTFTPGVLADIGAFGAFFQPDFAAYSNPILVSSVDGVGTKLKVAFLMNRHDTVGQDLVNHCVNDIAVCGAKPLFFLDYFATGALAEDAAFAVIQGFSAACKANGCALIGGETAEMPDMYAAGEYDLAGTIVGVVDRDSIVDGRKIQSGDQLIGIPSSGLHTNGYSLARKVLLDVYDVHDHPPELGGASVGETLLAIHRPYLGLIQTLLASGVDVRGLAHVTGGGIEGNTRRILPEGLKLEVDYSAWDRPSIFTLIQETGGVPEEDMRKALNLGIGLIIVASAADTDSICMTCSDIGESPVVLGTVKSA
jgi:phosphoribosylformylglycinamidine cyclo-ligase